MPMATDIVPEDSFPCTMSYLLNIHSMVFYLLYFKRFESGRLPISLQVGSRAVACACERSVCSRESQVYPLDTSIIGLR